MEKTFETADVERRMAARWEEAGAFRSGRADRVGAEPYCIVIPPPNVTGNLHMGHALNNTLQDILCRYWRMNGKDVLWQPGTDHAGIATQMVVERQMAERQEPDRRAIGREAFLEKVWTWKAESGGAIVGQLKRLGASCDWSRERFTLDEGLSKAVAKVFVQLHRDGLIYKAKRLVNWDPKFQTAISDLEVMQVESKGSYKWTRGDEKPFDIAALRKVLSKNPNGHFYYFEYPLVDALGAETGEVITVATTRPETMLGDTAVAVHPEDPRFAARIGQKLRLPLVGRLMPLIGDEYSDPEKGTGAVKITPAHDFNDFEVGKRHEAEGVRAINILDAEARITLKDNLDFFEGLEAADFELARLVGTIDGVDRFEARIRIVEQMALEGRLAKIEPTTTQTPHGDRSHVVIEPWLTDQWYVDAKTLAKPALAAVREGKTRFIPRNWEKTYFEWLENIQPWCVSRQLWWGHQIPAWYFDGGLFGLEKKIFVEETEEEAIIAAHKYLIENNMLNSLDQDGEKIEPTLSQVASLLKRDPDVLDTWFSSALWPFSTLGWPEQTPELARYYPTSVLVTGFDIIFFWVARMMMMGMHFMKEVPFHDVYIHALVRDEKGAKMSKSKGNVMDPLDIVDGIGLEALIAKRVDAVANKGDAAKIAADTRNSYPQGIPRLGVDALRFTLAAMAAQGRDVKLSIPRIEGYRNFATKLWNASRFAELNGCVRVAGYDPAQAKAPLNRWIVSQAAKAVAETSEAIEAFRFNDAANAAYRFVWSVFCDWHLELAKPVLQGEATDAVLKAETQATIAHVLDVVYGLLHPFMPFVTEELWAIKGAEGPARSGPLALGPWPARDVAVDSSAEAEIGFVVDLISELRSLRSEMGVAPSAPLPLIFVKASQTTKRIVADWGDTIQRLARVSGFEFVDVQPRGSAPIVVRDSLVALPLAGVVDIEAETARLTKEIAKEKGEVAKVDAKLANAEFVAKAPEEVVEENRERRVAALERIEKMASALARLKQI